MEETNPFLQHEDYFKPYRENISDLRNQPEVIEWDKLCYQIFEMTEDGKRFIQLVKERYLLYPLVQRGTATYQIDVLWQEGFKDFGRMLVMALVSHDQRIKAGKNPT